MRKRICLDDASDPHKGQSCRSFSEWNRGVQMRDQIKDREYFNEFLQEEQARITRFSDKLANSEVKPERQLAVKTKIHELKLGILTDRYSRVYELSALE